MASNQDNVMKLSIGDDRAREIFEIADELLRAQKNLIDSQNSTIETMADVIELLREELHEIKSTRKSK